MLRSRLGSPPNRSIILDNVVCTGREKNLSECDHNGVGVNNCDRSEEAGVECEGISTNTCNYMYDCGIPWYTL